MSYPFYLARKFKGIPKAISQRLHEKHRSGLDLGQQIRIHDLVCPLRYDIPVRANFISLFAENKDLLEKDIDDFLENPAARAYKVWFKEVNVRRFYPEIYNNKNKIHERFSRRVKNVQKLWASMSSNGFDYSHPIKLMSGKLVHEVNDKNINISIFAGDGCHRIACLLVMGKNVLEPEEYQVTFRAGLLPLNNTQILLEKLPVNLQGYLSFISDGYCEGQTITTPDEALAYVSEHSPQRLAELEGVFQQDILLLG